MITKTEIICIFESDLSIKELSKQYGIKSNLIVLIRIGLYGQCYTQDLISGRLKRLNKNANRSTKLELEEVEFIISSERTHVQLAALFNVSKDTIFDIRHGNTWKHVDRSNLKAPKRPFRYGEQSSRSKLTEKDVLEIIKLLATERNGTIAKKFNVSSGTISSIRRNQTWKHLTRISVYNPKKLRSGIYHHNSTITEPMLREIMKSSVTLRVLSKKFNLAQSTICRVRQRYFKEDGLCYSSQKSVSNW